MRDDDRLDDLEEDVRRLARQLAGMPVRQSPGGDGGGAGDSTFKWYRVTTELPARGAGNALGIGAGVPQALTNGATPSWQDDGVQTEEILNSSRLSVQVGTLVPTVAVEDSQNNVRQVHGFGDVGDLRGFPPQDGAAVTYCAPDVTWSSNPALALVNYTHPNFTHTDLCGNTSNWHTTVVCP